MSLPHATCLDDVLTNTRPVLFNDLVYGDKIVLTDGSAVRVLRIVRHRKNGRVTITTTEPKPRTQDGTGWVLIIPKEDS